MVKSIFIPFICIFLSSCLDSNILDNSSKINIPVSTEKQIAQEIEENYSKKECIINKAESFLGSEEVGNNQDFTNKELKTLLERSGWKKGQAWCSYMVKGLLDDCEVPNKVNGYSPSSYNKSDVIFTDDEFKQEFDSEDVLVLSLSYNKYLSDKSRYKAIGHTGIVYKLTSNKIYSMEGNTTEDQSINDNEGQGFYKKIRPLTNKTHITR
jgi:hypothetical protein